MNRFCLSTRDILARAGVGGALILVLLSGCGDSEEDPINARAGQVPVEGVNRIIREKYERNANIEAQLKEKGGRIRLEIDFSYTKLSDDDLANIELPENLTLLDLAGTSITDAGVAHLANNPSLKGLLHLNLARTMVTDACVEDIKKFSNLLSVRFDGTPVVIKRHQELIKLFNERQAQNAAARQP